MAPAGAMLALPPAEAPSVVGGHHGARIEEPPAIAANVGDNSEIIAPDDD